MLKDFNHALVDLVQRPPHSHYDMVIELARGAFVIEGKQSNVQDAIYYADEHSVSKEVWKALTVVNQ